jgi:hypothetical protein
LQPREVFGLSAVIDLSVRYGNTLVSLFRRYVDPLTRHAGSLVTVVRRLSGAAETASSSLVEPLVPAISLLAGAVGSPPLTQVTGLAVVGIGVYLYGGRLLAPLDPALGSLRGVRLLLLGTAVAYVQIVRGGQLDRSTVGAVLFVSLCLAVTLFAYGQIVCDWAYFDADGYLAKTLDGLLRGDLRGDLRSDFQRDGLTGALARVTWIVAVLSAVQALAVWTDS